jgi:hypothetical protein
VTYYQQHQLEDARVQFEALQAIDPDDISAHYNLSILYNRMGMKKEAAQQAALFTTKKVDPGAPSYSLDFLQKHPEISTESVPWHMHTDIPQYSGEQSAQDTAPKSSPGPTPKRKGGNSTNTAKSSSIHREISADFGANPVQGRSSGTLGTTQNIH